MFIILPNKNNIIEEQLHIHDVVSEESFSSQKRKCKTLDISM